VIDLKDIYKNAEFLGKLGIAPFCAGKTGTWHRYQQSYPQYLGVSSLFYRNQGLSARFGFKSCKWCAIAQGSIAAHHARAAMA
jgi:hypothetical protein